MMNLMTRWFDQLTKTYPWLGWLKINLGVKRWIVLLLGGIVVLGVGIAFALVELYQGGAMPLPLDVLTMQFLPRWFRAILLGVVGVGSIVVALWKLSDTILSPFTMN